jgi:hypothetical protein
MTTFGIELEIVPQAGFEVGFKSRIVRALQAAGINANSAYYSGRAYNVWQVKDDSSVSIRRNGTRWSGCEVVSPVLDAGEEAWSQIKLVCDTLEANGATANVSCGMHVHVGISRMNATQVRNILLAYGTFAPEIESVLPRSRRDGGSSYRWCRRLWDNFSQRLVIQRLRECSTIEAMANTIAFRHSRYCAISLAAYNRIGTIEFRQHSGTANAAKALNWAKWCVAFVERYCNEDVTTASQPEAAQAGGIVLERVAGRGAMRMPARGGARRLAVAFRQGAVLNQDRIREIRGKATASETFWINYLSRKCGMSFIRTANGWSLDTGSVEPVTQHDAFTQCFGVGAGLLPYFGSRRRALA